MKVSFIVPFHTESRLVYDCLDSILAQQTQHQFEVVLVDNGRAPLRLEFPRVAHVRVVHCEKPGPAAARNAGAMAASGELLAFVDSDVRLATDWFEKNLQELLKHPLIGASQGPIVTMAMNPAKPSLLDRYRWALKQQQTKGTFIYGGADGYLLNTAACLVRAVAYRRVGGFEERLLRAEDMFFTQSLLARGFFLTTAPAAKAEVRFDGTWMEYLAKSFRQGRAEKQLGGSLPKKVQFDDPLNRVIQLVTRLLRRWGASHEVSPIPLVEAVPSSACRLLGLHPFARLVWTGQTLHFFQLQNQLIGSVVLENFNWQFPLNLDEDLERDLMRQQILSRG